MGSFLRVRLDRLLHGATPSGVLLIATLVLAGWLGYQALDAAFSHRRTAEAVLSDYAEISATEFSRIARTNFGEVLDEVFAPVGRRMRGRRIPSPRVVGWDMDDAVREQGCRCQAFRSPLALFRADLVDPGLEILPDTFPSHVRERIAGLVAEPGPTRGRWQVGLVTAGAGELLDEPVGMGYMVARDTLGRVEAVFGFLVRREAVGQLLQHWYDARPLLPQPIAGEQPNDSLLYVTVRDPDGATIFASAVAYPTALGAGSSLGPEFGDLTVQAAVRPDAAPELIIGGLPNSRLPLLAVFLLLTLGVGVAAVVQLRRERTFQRLREDFVSGVSHELRTPLAQIRMFAELQEAGKLTSEADRRRATAAIHREARRLSHLVENVLQFSRLRWRPVQGMPKEELDLAEAVSEGADALEPLLRDRGMKLVFDGPPGARVRVSRDALNRIVVNLLDNALKYGPRGQTVRVEVSRANGTAILSVEDEGPGVPRADRRRIWKPYSRLERDVKARLPGTGIGLSVVSDLVGLQGGRVWVEDGGRGGARFVVELPLEEAGASGVEEAAPERAGTRS